MKKKNMVEVKYFGDVQKDIEEKLERIKKIEARIEARNNNNKEKKS